MEKIEIPPNKDFTFQAMVIDKPFKEVEEAIGFKFIDSNDDLGELGYICIKIKESVC